jgi:hypothetical protein
LLNHKRKLLKVEAAIFAEAFLGEREDKMEIYGFFVLFKDAVNCTLYIGGPFKIAPK